MAIIISWVAPPTYATTSGKLIKITPRSKTYYDRKGITTLHSGTLIIIPDSRD